MNKTTVIVSCLALVALAIFTSWFVDSQFATVSKHENSTSRSSQTQSSQQPTEKGVAATKEGIMTCLIPKGSGSQQISSCALGLQTDSGDYYALSDNDYKLMGVPTGQRIRVHGKLRPDANSSYQISGVLTVDSFERL